MSISVVFENYATKVIIPIHGFYCVSVTVHAIIRGIIRYLQALIIILYIVYPYVLAHGIQCQPKQSKGAKKDVWTLMPHLYAIYTHGNEITTILLCAVLCSVRHVPPLSLLHSDAFVPKTIFLHK